MGQFARIPGSRDEFPKTYRDGGDNQSYGFLLAHKLQTGVMRGTQTIVGANGKKITLGVIPGTNNEFGIGFFDENGNLIKKETGPTDFFYDPDNKTNMMQVGKLPNDTYNVAIAQEGDEVEDAFD